MDNGAIQIGQMPREIYYHLEFEIPMRDYVFTGALSDDGKGVIVTYADWADCIQMAVWFRCVVPSRYSIAFTDEGSHFYTELKPGVTEAELRLLLK